MDEQPVAPPPPTAPQHESPEKKPDWNKVLIGAGAFILLLAIGGLSFFFGRQSGQDEAPSISPTPAERLGLATEPRITPTTFLTPTTFATTAPSPTPSPSIKSKTLSSKAGLDGFRSSNDGGNDGLDIRAGRNSNLVTRGFVSFDLADLPSGATVTEATLRIYQAKTVGNPYGVGGALKVDHLDYEDSLDKTDYSAAALLSSFATVTNNAAIEWKDVEVTDQVKDDLGNSRDRSQFRVHFVTENIGGDVTGDFVYFDSANSYADNSGHTPELVVKYY